MEGRFVISITVGTFFWEATILLVRMRTTARNTPRRATTHGCLVIETLTFETLNRGRNPFLCTEKVPAEMHTVGQKIFPLVDIIKYHLDRSERTRGICFSQIDD